MSKDSLLPKNPPSGQSRWVRSLKSQLDDSRDSSSLENEIFQDSPATKKYEGKFDTSDYVTNRTRLFKEHLNNDHSCLSKQCSKCLHVHGKSNEEFLRSLEAKLCTCNKIYLPPLETKKQYNVCTCNKLTKAPFIANKVSDPKYPDKLNNGSQITRKVNGTDRPINSLTETQKEVPQTTWPSHGYDTQNCADASWINKIPSTLNQNLIFPTSHISLAHQENPWESTFPPPDSSPASSALCSPVCSPLLSPLLSPLSPLAETKDAREDLKDSNTNTRFECSIKEFHSCNAFSESVNFVLPEQKYNLKIGPELNNSAKSRGYFFNTKTENGETVALQMIAGENEPKKFFVPDNAWGDSQLPDTDDSDLELQSGSESDVSVPDHEDEDTEEGSLTGQSEDVCNSEDDGIDTQEESKFLDEKTPECVDSTCGHSPSFGNEFHVTSFHEDISSATSAYGTGSASTPDVNAAVEVTVQFPIKKGCTWLRFSLFPKVPPTINFRIHDFTALDIPSDVKKALKWKITTVTPIIVKKILANSGMRLVRSRTSFHWSNRWIGMWGKHMRSRCFKNINEYQKINHFPGTFQIGRKDSLWRNFLRLRAIHGKKEFDYLPTTFVLPMDIKQLRQAWEKAGPKQMWIAKPPASARGNGIRVIHKFLQIPRNRPILIQKYLSNPYLINGIKFDLRIYVYVSSFYPLRLYIYKDGLVRFASVTYSSSLRSVGDKYMHLTNFSINRKCASYTANTDVNACKGHKWSLKALWRFLEEDGVDTTAIWNSIVDVVVKTVISCEATVTTLTRLNIKSTHSCHELFGFDIMLDENLKVWLLEVNISPSLNSHSQVDVTIKGQMIRDLLNLAGFTLPPHLDKKTQLNLAKKLGLDTSKEPPLLCYDPRLFKFFLSLEDRAKQATFVHMDREIYLRTILENLTPDDIRQLVLAEDERSRAGQFIRVFPTHTTYKYHKYFERPRYYNCLYDAWETRFHRNRQEGIRFLGEACQAGIHLRISSSSMKVTKMSKQKGSLSQLSRSSSPHYCCSNRKFTGRAVQRVCRSALALLVRMRIHSNRPSLNEQDDAGHHSDSSVADDEAPADEEEF